ncbi:hypothetical protein CKAH01_06619 [Colletotrichum kahawae]|uniref:Uncharacterized protein n=1 Tax=Colletotrichum kahawae TaxID=34407 RepID=A0AAE0D529_COLKA|nr:hypothetical protein CKAH01_06619 [Colletotrichum kahawae]
MEVTTDPPSRLPWTNLRRTPHCTRGARTPPTPTVLQQPFHHITDQPHHLKVLQASRRPAKQATVFRPVFGRSSRRSCREKSDPGPDSTAADHHHHHYLPV